MPKLPSPDNHYSLHDQLEDGTLPFHAILALDAGLDTHARLYGSMSHVSAHTNALMSNLHAQLSALRHSNGAPAAVIYGSPAFDFKNTKRQGATVAFNLLTPSGGLISYLQVEAALNAQRVYVRSGGLCNPGGIAISLNLKYWEMKRAWSQGHRCGGGVARDGSGTEIVGGKATGVVRASLGAMSTWADCARLVEVITELYVDNSVRHVVTNGVINGLVNPTINPVVDTHSIHDLANSITSPIAASVTGMHINDNHAK